MKKPTFRHPAEMKEAHEERVPVSARVKKSTQKLLSQQAKANGMSFALLIANVIDDYADWLEAEPKKQK
jgi:uncharacterized protein (DUF1778 family)